MPENSTVSYLNKHAATMRSNLASWFGENKRDLPWRRIPSLYRTVVSEFMLQQTQVKTVLPYFDRWLEEFPNFSSLATAEESRVLKLWEGLGYYSRARNLHRLAREIGERETVPEDPESWRQFKGIGPYTAAAITSISFRYPVACVDGNAIRILARLTADETLFKDNSQATKSLGPLADILLDRENPGRHNEAIMELGATLCTKSRPQCLLCPLSGDCRARNRDPQRFPRKEKRKVHLETIDRVWIVQEGKLLLHRANATSRRLSGILELPTLTLLGQNPTQLLARGYKPLVTRKRGISKSLITEPIWALAIDPALVHPELEWVPLDALNKATLSGPHKRWIRELVNR